MRERKRGGEIDNKAGFDVSFSDGSVVLDELSSAENTRAWSDEGETKLNQNVHDKEEISDGSEESDEETQGEVDIYAGGAADDRDVEIERVEEECDHGGYEEDLVPSYDEFAAWVEDLVPPWNFA